jgi:hypothetical protein
MNWVHNHAGISTFERLNFAGQGQRQDDPRILAFVEWVYREIADQEHDSGISTSGDCPD